MPLAANTRVNEVEQYFTPRPDVELLVTVFLCQGCVWYIYVKLVYGVRLYDVLFSLLRPSAALVGLHDCFVEYNSHFLCYSMLEWEGLNIF